MLSIAVCDDVQEDLAAVEGMLGKVNRIKLDLDVFTNAADLLNTIRLEGGYDLYILDVVMPKMNGIELAAAIREQDSHALFIFLSAHEEYVLSALDCIIFQYLIKPVSEKRITEVLLKAEKYLQRNRQLFRYRFNKVQHSIPYCKIYYFYKVSRKVYIFTEDGIAECNMRMQDILNEVKNSVFVRINRSYIINLQYVEEMRKGKVRVAGTLLTISDAHRREAEEKYFEYTEIVQ